MEYHIYIYIYIYIRHRAFGHELECLGSLHCCSASSFSLDFPNLRDHTPRYSNLSDLPGTPKTTLKLDPLPNGHFNCLGAKPRPKRPLLRAISATIWGQAGQGRTRENRALVWVLARFRRLEAFPNRRVFRNVLCVLFKSHPNDTFHDFNDFGYPFGGTRFTQESYKNYTLATHGQK